MMYFRRMQLQQVWLSLIKTSPIKLLNLSFQKPMELQIT